MQRFHPLTIKILILTLSACAADPVIAGPPAVGFRKHIIDSEFPAISAVAVDLDGNGRLDVVAAGGPSGGPSEWSHRVYAYRAPTWERSLVTRLDDKAILLHIDQVVYSVPNRSPTDAEAPVEIVLTDGALGDIWWYRYDRANQTWQGTTIVSGYIGAHGTASGDIDGDGYADIVVPTQTGDPRRGMLWARNPGPEGLADGKPWETIPVAESFSVTGWQEYVRLADLNGNGRLDILHGSHARDGWMGFWLQPDDPRQPWAERRLEGPMANATNLDAADLSGDGRLDLVGTEGHGVGVWLFAAPDYTPVRVDDSLKSTHSLGLGDLNGNGRIDIVTCGYESTTVAVFYNRGDLTFERFDIDTAQAAYDLRLIDMNGNGRLDILLSGQNSGNLVWYENSGSEAGDPR